MNLDPNQLSDTFKQIALPALAGAAGTGALGAYASSQAHPEGETPQQRRHRILRNAMMMGGLGGMAGGALPLGLKTLTQPYLNSGAVGVGPVDKAIDFGMRNVGALGAGAVGMGFYNRASDKSQQAALNKVLAALKMQGPNAPESMRGILGVGKGVEDIEQVKQILRQPKATDWLMQSLAGGIKDKTDYNRAFEAADVLREAGHPGVSHEHIVNMMNEGELRPDAYHNTTNPTRPGIQEAYSKYLSGNRSILDRFMGALTKDPHVIPGARGYKIINKWFPELETAPKNLSAMLQRMYSGAVRPGARAALGTMGPIGKLGLLGAGIYGANKLQDKLMGG